MKLKYMPPYLCLPPCGWSTYHLSTVISNMVQIVSDEKKDYNHPDMNIQPPFTHPEDQVHRVFWWVINHFVTKRF